MTVFNEEKLNSVVKYCPSIFFNQIQTGLVYEIIPLDLNVLFSLSPSHPPTERMHKVNMVNYTGILF